MAISDKRFERLEEKVDVLKDDMHEVKTDLKVHITSMNEKMNSFGSHITGDNKIINNIEPMIERFPDIVEVLDRYKYEKERNRRIVKGLGISATLITVIIGLSRFLRLF